MKTKAVLFDLDGTLVNTLPDICGFLNDVRVLRGLTSLSNPDIQRHIGRGMEYLVAGCFPELPNIKPIEIINEIHKIYAQKVHKGGYIYTGVVDTLKTLKSKYKIGIATNKPEELAIKTLKHYLPGIKFDVIAAPENVSKRKPNPEHLLEPLALLGVKPEEAVFVGDDPVDFQSSQSAFVPFWGAGWGFGGVVAEGRVLKEFSELLQKISV